MRNRVKLLGMLFIMFLSGYIIGYFSNNSSTGYYTYEESINGNVWIPKWRNGVWDVYADEKHPAEIEFELESFEDGQIILIIADLITEFTFFNDSEIGYIKHSFTVSYSIQVAIMWFLLFDEMFYYREGSPIYVYTRITQWVSLPHNLPEE